MVRKLFLVITITTCIFGSLIAQDGKKAKFGIKTGLNISNIYGEDLDGNNAKPGFHLGAFVEIPLNNNWYLQPELMYSEQGTKNGDDKLEFNYITIPFMFKYYFNNKFNIEFGPQFNYSANAKVSNDKSSVDISDEINQKDFTAGLDFGFGFLFNSHFGISARYNLGLTSITNKNDLLGDSEFKNTVFQLSLAFKF